jgi:hypothetical protein
MTFFIFSLSPDLNFLITFSGIDLKKNCLLQSLQICLNLGYSLITLRESCNYQLPSFRLKQLNIIILFNSENCGINIIKGTGYQNGQFFFKSIPENVIKKLRSGDNEKMKKVLFTYDIKKNFNCN